VIGLDTNVLVRYLAQDEQLQSAVATQLIEGNLTAGAQGFVSVVTLIEVVWVLQGCYKCTKEEVLEILGRLLRVKQLVVQDAEIVWQAVRVFKAGQADFSDCLIERMGHAHECEYTVTFDKAAVKTTGMRLLS